MGPLHLDSSREPGASLASAGSSTPIRPKASPRLTPSNSSCNSFSSYEQLESAIPSSEEGSPFTGRTLVRVPAHERLEPRAMIRLQAGPNVGDLNSFTIRQRIMSRDLCGEPEDIDGSYMEPLPFERFRYSLSEEMHKVTTFDSSVDLTNFAGHRDTFAIFGLGHLRIRGPEFPKQVFQRLLHYIDFKEYLALRLSCRCWSAGVTLARPLVTPPVYKLPAEILENVYAYLSPIDFNAARHTCRAWMIGSLQERLLTRVLKDGGWWRAAKADVDLHEGLNGDRTAESINDEWLLSKRLATECSLLPGWTGNGLPRKLCSSSGRQSNHTGVTFTSETDFSELTNGYNSRLKSSLHGSAVHFTVSACGRFVLVVEDHLIYIYSLQNSNSSASHLHGGHISPVTTVICPRRVLAVSMDTSSHRFAVAALLEGRVGLVCDLQEHTSSSRERCSPHVLSNVAPITVSGTVCPSRSLHTQPNSHLDYATSQASPSDLASTRSITEASLPDVSGARHSRKSWSMNDPLVSPTSESNSGSLTKTGYTPLEAGDRSIYHNLCSARDQPRSVAICPQRRCVAFGCSAGIELHWIDALTGQDLNRWFPLTAPSDFLYFLSPRPGVDSAKKLRLISSASHPKAEEGLAANFGTNPSTDATRYRGMTWEEEFSGLNAWGNAWRGCGWCDHYHAVPLSDGCNVLFTDPMEGSLCLGSDAPPGAGTTKLTQRFVFSGPGEPGVTVVPRIYTAGRELRWGVRVLVGYGEAIWLFVVPPDMFFEDANTLARPIIIEGVKLGDMQGLVDLAVDSSNGNLTIWSFALDGMAYCWQLNGRQHVERRIGLKDGTVTSLEDADGDTYMFNTSQAAVHLDGAGPLRLTTHHGATCLDPSLHPSVRTPLLGLHDRVVDHDGDTNMPDAASGEDEGYGSGADDQDEFAQAGGAFAIHAPPLRGRWSDEDADWVPDYLAQMGGDIEDEGLGVDVLELTRLEVEVSSS